MSKKIQLFIGGDWQDGSSGEFINVVNPANEEVISSVAVATTEDLDRALQSVKKGFEQWKKTPAPERCTILRKAASLMRSRIDEISMACTLEQGKPLAQARLEIIITANYFDDIAECGQRTTGRYIPEDRFGVRRNIVYEPIGPIYAASPWNLPVMMPGRKIVTALAAGCSVIVKPSEETPETAVLIVQCLVDAGVPRDALNLVFGNPSHISDHLLSSPIIKKISFTGSTPVGKMLANKAGSTLKKATLELGGHAPVIINKDVDIDKVVSLTAPTRYSNTGQSCIAPTRFFVHEDIYHDFITSFTEKVKQMRVGDGIDESTDVGPLTSERRIPVMDYLVQDALSKDAILNCGGQRMERKGFFYAPTVLSNISDDMKIMQEEPFGPITPIAIFSDTQEVINRANSTPYGLASYIFSNDLAWCQKVADNLEAGLVGINTVSVASTPVPFGGVKDSGIGREGSMDGILECMTTKSVSIG